MEPFDMLHPPENAVDSNTLYAVADLGREVSVAAVKDSPWGKRCDDSARSCRAAGLEATDLVESLDRLVASGHLEWVETTDGKARYVRVTERCLRTYLVPGLLYGCTTKEAETAPAWLREAAGLAVAGGGT